MTRKILISRATRGLGYAYSPFEAPDKPIYEGTVRQVLRQMDEDGNRRALLSGGINVHTQWFLKGQKIVALDGYAEPSWMTAGFRDLDNAWMGFVMADIEDGD